MSYYDHTQLNKIHKPHPNTHTCHKLVGTSECLRNRWTSKKQSFTYDNYTSHLFFVVAIVDKEKVGLLIKY